MRFVIQRVDEASVLRGGKAVGKIKKGFVVLVGISNTDTCEIADKMIRKLINLRIFSDENDKTNLNINSINGELLIISPIYLICRLSERKQAILHKCRNPELAENLYEYIIKKCSEEVPHVAHGVFWRAYGYFPYK